MQMFLPEDGSVGEIKFAVEDCVQIYNASGQLSTKQRVALFGALVVYLFEHADIPLLERYIQNISLHEMVQQIVDLDVDGKDTFTISTVPCKGGLLIILVYQN